MTRQVAKYQRKRRFLGKGFVLVRLWPLARTLYLMLTRLTAFIVATLLSK